MTTVAERRSDAPPRRGRRQPPASLFAALLASAVAIGVFVTIRPGPARGPLILPRHADLAAAYHVTYRVNVGSKVTTEDLWVNRPFEAWDATYAGTTTSGSRLSLVVTRLGRQSVNDAGGAATVFEPGPAPTSFDVRLDTLAGATGSLLQPEGTRRIAAHVCRVYRTAVSLISSALTGAPTAADHVDTCVDGGGVVLSERHVSGGKVVLQRTAVLITEGAIGQPFATAGDHLPVEQGGGKVVTVTNDSRPPGTTSWELVNPPAGFSRVGRFAVVFPNADASLSAGSRTLRTAVADVFTDGPDVIVVSNGETAGPTISAPLAGTPVAQGSLGSLGSVGGGRLALSPLASSVRVDLPGVGAPYVDVRGTLPPAQLVAIARSLTPEPAGTIVVAPDVTSDGM